MKKPIIDLAGMEADVSEITEALSKVIRPESSAFKKAVAEIAIARIGDGEKLAAIFILLMSEDGGASSEAPYRLIQKMMNVSRTRMDGVRKGLAGWEQLEITKGTGTKPSRYRLLKPVLNCGENVLVTRPWDNPQGLPEDDELATRLKGHKATRLKGHKEASDPSEGSQPLRDPDQSVCLGVSTPTGCGDSGRDSTPTSTLPSQNPDCINPDIARADSNSQADEELDALLASNGVVVNCVTISHPDFVIKLPPLDMENALLMMPQPVVRKIAKLQALQWATGQAPLKDDPTNYVRGILKRSKPRLAAMEMEIKEAIANAKAVDSPQRPVYVNARQAAKDKAADEFEAYKIKYYANRKEIDNG